MCNNFNFHLSRFYRVIYRARHYTGSAAVNNAERQQAERANHGNDDIENTILYIERFYQLGQPVEHLPDYDVWKKWKDKQQK